MNQSLLKKKRGREDIIKEIKDLNTLIINRKEIALEYLNKYKEDNEIGNLLDAIYYDNTNDEIVYYYLDYLKKNDESEYKKQFLYRHFFMTVEKRALLEQNNIFSINTPKQIFNSIVDKCLYDAENITSTWKEKTLSFVNDSFSIKVPYFLRRINNNDNIYQYGKSDKTILTFKNSMEPTFPFSLEDESSCYMYSIILLEEWLNSSKDEYIFNAVLFVLQELMKADCKAIKISDYVNMISISREGDELVCLLKEILKQNNINSELIGFEKETSDETKNELKEEEFDDMLEKDNDIEKEILEDNQYFLKSKSKIQNLLKKFMKQVIHTSCIKSVFENLFPKMTDYLYVLDDNFIDYIFNDIELFGMFNPNEFGNTDIITNKVAINIERKKTLLYRNEKNINFLLYFSIWLITAIHEIIGHSARKYLYYFIEENKEFHTDRDKQVDDDGGKYIESLLFGEGKEQYIILNVEKIIFITDISNWDKPYHSFHEEFVSIKNNSSNNEEIILKMKENNIMNEIINYAHISDKSLNNLINDNHSFGFSLQSKMSPLIIINISGKNNKKESKIV